MFSRLFAARGRAREQQPPEIPAEETHEADPPGGPEPEGSLTGRCYRMGGELHTVLKDGTNVLVRSDKDAIPWYEPRSVVLENLARHGLEKPACSNSGFWYDAGRVPIEEHLAVQNKKPPGSVKHWVDL